MIRFILSATSAAALAFGAAAFGAAAADREGSPDGGHFSHGQFFIPGNLVVSRSVYDNKASNVVVGTVLPPNCAATIGGCGAPSGAPMTVPIRPCGTT